MQCEAVAPIFMRGLYILEEFGMINLNDFSIDGVNIAIQHVSPLAMAQDQEELTAITRYAEIVSGFFGPQGLMTMTNPTEFAKELARLLHVKDAILPTQEQMEAVKQLAGQALAQQLNPQGGGGTPTTAA